MNKYSAFSFIFIFTFIFILSTSNSVAQFNDYTLKLGLQANGLVTDTEFDKEESIFAVPIVTNFTR